MLKQEHIAIQCRIDFRRKNETTTYYATCGLKSPQVIQKVLEKVDEFLKCFE